MLKYANGLFYTDNFYSCYVYEILAGLDVRDGRKYITEIVGQILRPMSNFLLPKMHSLETRIKGSMMLRTCFVCGITDSSSWFRFPTAIFLLSLSPSFCPLFIFCVTFMIVLLPRHCDVILFHFIMHVFPFIITSYTEPSSCSLLLGALFTAVGMVTL